MNDAKLSALWKSATLDCPRADNCPSADELSAALRGVDLGERRQLVLEALSSCARCAAIAQVGAELAPAASARPRAAGWAIAASLALAVSTFGVWQLRPAPPPDDLRGLTLLVEPRDGSQMPSAPALFRWPHASGALCKLELRDQRGALHLQKPGLRDGEFLPEPPLNLPADRYLWQVQCAAQVLGPFSFVVQ